MFKGHPSAMSTTIVRIGKARKSDRRSFIGWMRSVCVRDVVFVGRSVKPPVERRMWSGRRVLNSECMIYVNVPRVIPHGSGPVGFDCWGPGRWAGLSAPQLLTRNDRNFVLPLEVVGWSFVG